MTSKAKVALESFKSMFPGLYRDGMTVTEVRGDVLIINPTPGKRGRKYTYILRPDGTWHLSYE